MQYTNFLQYKHITYCQFPFEVDGVLNDSKWKFDNGDINIGNDYILLDILPCSLSDTYEETCNSNALQQNINNCDDLYHNKELNNIVAKNSNQSGLVNTCWTLHKSKYDLYQDTYDSQFTLPPEHQ